MSESPEKLKNLLADLGRPTKRGIRKCPKCGTVNGTRGNSCKNKACDVVFRDQGTSKKDTTEACKIVTNDPGCQVYSVRLRDRGPDYRNFVIVPSKEGATLEKSAKSFNDQSSSENARCYVEACQKNKQTLCSHIEATQRCFSESQPLDIKDSIVMSLNIPSDQQEILRSERRNDVLVQRVSKTSFVVKCIVTNRHPLGYLHIMFLKHNKDEVTSDRKFLCTCKASKAIRDNDGTQSNAGEGIEVGVKYCIHFYACLSAFASDDSLNSEFEYFLAQLNPTACAPTLFHLVGLPPAPIHSAHIEETDSNNHISVEIMRDNMSLLDGITAVDDTSLHNVNVQSLDQIIITDVDDSFGDAAVLDSLEDADSQQVCRILSAQENFQYVSQLSNAENLSQAVNLSSSTNLTKKRRIGSGDLTTDTSQSCQSLVPVSTNNFDSSQKHPPVSKIAFAKGYQNSSSITITTFTTLASTVTANTCPIVSQLPLLPQHPVILPPTLETPKTTHVIQESTCPFEIWLAGVTERLNATMNYHFSGKPDPLIYYISMDYFERLRERLTLAGNKKRRLPNQSMIVSRTDRPPAGTFTKHVWKITNLLHVINIFENQILPLKVRQYFIKGSNGIYEEFKPPREMDKKNQFITPRVHKTFLKVGKNDPNATESVPFIIEWIPDILPHSKLGEVTIMFEFAHCNSAAQHELK